MRAYSSWPEACRPIIGAGGRCGVERAHDAAPVIRIPAGSSSELCTAAVFELVCYSGTFDVDAAYARLQIPYDIKVVIEFAQL